MGVQTNAYQIAAEMQGLAAGAQARVDAKTTHHAMLLKTRVQAHASGRPGPNVVTGDYRRSWTMEAVPNGQMVGTNKPQARRLEWGFYGADSLGRVYHQPPYPHVGPAYDETVPGYLEDLGTVLTDL